jgi:hypothetical protein
MRTERPQSGAGGYCNYPDMGPRLYLGTIEGRLVFTTGADIEKALAIPVPKPTALAWAVRMALSRYYRMFSPRRLDRRYTSEHAFLGDGSAWSARLGRNIGVL